MPRTQQTAVEELQGQTSSYNCKDFIFILNLRCECYSGVSVTQVLPKTAKSLCVHSQQTAES